MRRVGETQLKDQTDFKTRLLEQEEENGTGKTRWNNSMYQSTYSRISERPIGKTQRKLLIVKLLRIIYKHKILQGDRRKISWCFH